MESKSQPVANFGSSCHFDYRCRWKPFTLSWNCHKNSPIKELKSSETECDSAFLAVGSMMMEKSNFIDIVSIQKNALDISSKSRFNEPSSGSNNPSTVDPTLIQDNIEKVKDCSLKTSDSSYPFKSICSSPHTMFPCRLKWNPPTVSGK